MQMILLILGLYLILSGIAIKNKKWLWIHQGLIKRPVDTERYCKYMGLADAAFGSIYLLLHILSSYLYISEIIIAIVFVCYVIILVYGERKYKVEEEFK